MEEYNSDTQSDADSEFNIELIDNFPIWSDKQLFEINKNQILYSADAIEIIKHVSVWDKQRILSELQVSEILEFQLNYYKENSDFNFIGPFYISCINHEDYRIIDGQHRLVTIHRLIDKYKFKSFNIIVWVINVSNEQERYEIFKNINSSKPISIPDLLLDRTSNIINECCLNLYHKYPKFFQNTTNKKIHRPNLKLDILKNSLYEKNIVSFLNLQTSEELFDIIIEINNYYLNKDYNYFPKIRNTNTENILKRAIKKGKLLLGMYPNYEWIEQIIEIKLFNKQQESKISKVSNNIVEENIFKDTNLSDLEHSPLITSNNNSPIIKTTTKSDNKIIVNIRNNEKNKSNEILNETTKTDNKIIVNIKNNEKNKSNEILNETTKTDNKIIVNIKNNEKNKIGKGINEKNKIIEGTSKNIKIIKLNKNN
jgi:hypothetical protein